MFHVGQKVACVANRYRSGRSAPAFMVIGAVFTVRELWLSPRGNVVVRLEGHYGPMTKCGMERGFRTWMFRPVVERKTDITIFEAMLNTQSVDA